MMLQKEKLQAAAAALICCAGLAMPLHAQIRISELPEATNASGAQFVIIQGGATKRISEGTVRTIPATNVTGLGPFAISTNLAISNITGLQGALDAKLATNGTLPAGNITGLGPFATATNLTAAQIDDFSNAVVAFAPPTTNASLVTSGTLEDARISTNIARTSQLVASNIGGLGPFATATNLASTNISDFSAAVSLVSPPADWSTLSNKPSSFTPSPHSNSHHTGGTDAIAPNNISAAWQEVLSQQIITGDIVLSAGRNRRISVGSGSNVTAKITLPYDGNQPGDILTIVSIGVGPPFGSTYTIRLAGVFDNSGNPLSYINLATINGLGQSFTFVSNGSRSGWSLRSVDTHTHPVSQITGLGPFATATNLAITNVTGLQSALDGKLATNGTLPATNITGLGPFATATNLTAAQIDDFSNAVVAVAPPTTNASLLTTGTLDDARLSTNVVFQAQLGPFATATNLAITNVTGLQNALDGKLATNGTLPATNITGLGPFATATNLTSTNISDFATAVQALLTNTNTGISWSTVPTATNSAGTAGQIAYTNNYLYLCVGSNQWRRVLLGTWE